MKGRGVLQLPGLVRAGNHGTLSGAPHCQRPQKRGSARRDTEGEKDLSPRERRVQDGLVFPKAMISGVGDDRPESGRSAAGNSPETRCSKGAWLATAPLPLRSKRARAY